ncbi:GNAT family N-acetyltransferase [Pseudonocardia alni]|jgi:predicted GNAT family acetyltransferase|uniref:GNAT family N-acetyltransferase n=1 Tax=Pseudonocardia alni TaxID=33907 RepID=UPI0006CB58CB|nr:GNAT family N-acetyltransferase [Pseudonocardia sp. AL041005-10]ALE78511.1 GNAT family acetyltraansferase [Pseudonocardia sp. AL041005-10]
MSDSDSGTVVTHDTGHHRYEILVDGTVVGRTVYVDDGSRRIFFHTEVDPDRSGQGLAGTLVRFALEDTRTAGKRIVPVCPYVKRWTATHDGWADVLDPVTPHALELVGRAAR